MAQRYSVILTASNSQVRVQLLASFSGSFPYSGESGQQPHFTQAVLQAYSPLQRASHCPAFPQLPLGSVHQVHYLLQLIALSTHVCLLRKARIWLGFPTYMFTSQISSLKAMSKHSQSNNNSYSQLKQEIK